MPTLTEPFNAERSALNLSTRSVGVSGAPRVLLRAEGLVVLGAATWAFVHLEGSWAMFALLFFVPDVTLLGYLFGPKVGARVYNLGHSHLGPTLLACVTLAASGPPVAFQLAAIWIAHIGFDRFFGYGLKYETAFGDTHLGPAGRPPKASVAG